MLDLSPHSEAICEMRDLLLNAYGISFEVGNQTETVECQIVDGFFCLPINSDAENDHVSNIMVKGMAYNPSTKVLAKDSKKYLVIGDANNLPPTGAITVRYNYETFGSHDNESAPMDVTLTTNINYNYITLTTSKQPGETIYLSHAYTGSILISGVEEAPGESTTDTQTIDDNEVGKYAYTLTDQTVKIYGDVTYFRCSFQNVSSIDVTSATNLKTLYCDNNSISTLNVTNNTALTLLHCARNQLTAITGLNQLTELKKLFCTSNKITTLDLKQNTKLDTLSCGVNKISALDLSKNTALKWIHCTYNPLTTLDVTNNPLIKYFACYNCGLTSITGLKKLTSMTEFDCHSNKLASLDISKNTALITINCSANQLTTLDLSDNTAATSRNVRNQQKTVDCEIVDGYFCLPINADAVNDNVSGIKVAGVDYNPSTKVLAKDGKKYLVIGDTNNIPPTGIIAVRYYYETVGSLDNVSVPMDVTLTTEITNGIIKLVPGNWETRIALDYDTNVGLTVEGISDTVEPGAPGEYATYRTDADNSEEITFSGLITSISADDQGIASIDLTGDAYLTSVSLCNNQLMWLDLSKNTNLTDDTGTGVEGQKKEVYVCKVGDYWAVPMIYGANELKISNLKVNSTSIATKLLNDDEAKTSYLVVGEAAAPCPAQGSVITYDYLTDSNVYPQMDVTLTITSVPGVIELYTDKSNGENFRLSIRGAGSIIVSGIDDVGTLTTDGFLPLNISGTLNSQTIRIVGTVSSLTCNSQSLNGIKVDEAPGLTTLTVEDNNLTTFNLENNLYLKSLTCDRNDLTGLNVTKNTELTYLSCVDCALTELDVTKNTKLKELYVGYDVPRGTRNNMTSGSIDLSKNVALQKVHVENIGLNTLDVTNNIDLIDLYASTNNLTTIDLRENPDLQRLDLAHNQLPEIDVEANTELVYLYLTSNLLPSINVRKNTKLQDFRISSNQLPALDVTTLADLRVLQCAYNELPDIDVTRNPLLEYLYCDNNKLTAINTTQNPKLQYLSCAKNMITALDATVNPELLTLLCDENQISSLNVNGLTELRHLECSDNELYSLDVSTCTNIGNPYGGYGYSDYGFDCSRNHLMTLDLSQNEHMNKNSEVQVTLFGGQTLPVTPELVDGYLVIRMPGDAADAKVSNMIVAEAAYDPTLKVATKNDAKFLRFHIAAKDTHFGKDTKITYDYETGLDMEPTHKLMDVTLTMQNAHVQKIGSEGYGTLYLEYPALIPEGAEVYIVTDDCINKEKQVVELDKTANRINGGTVPAYTPMLSKATANEYILFNRSSEEGNAPEGNLMKGTMEDITVPAKSVVTLGKEASSGEYGFWIYYGTTVHAWRTYMDLDDVKDKMTAANAKGFALRFMDGNETTGIRSLNADGQDDTAYTLDGKKVCEAGLWNEYKNHLPKGVYIVGGRKVVLK